MKENKVLFKNTIVYTIGGLGSKLCAYFLVPLYTLSMSTADYGIADLYYLTLQIACVVGTMKIASSLVRFVLEDKTRAVTLFTASFKVIVISTVAVAILYGLLGDVYFGRYDIPIWFFPCFFLAAAYREICAELTKALDCNRIYMIGGLVFSTALLAASFVLLVTFDRGIRGYIEALIFANCLSIAYYSVKMNMFQYINLGQKSGQTIKNMLQYSAYLVPAALAYWIIQSSDRYMVNYFMGSAASGMYGVAYKIPGICATLSSFFVSAWYISAMHEKSNKDYYTETFASLFSFITLLVMAIILFDKVLARMLFKKEFYEAWQYAPLLIAGSLFSIGYNFFEIIFATYKDTKTIFYTTLIGALANVAMNYFMIPIWGIYGASVATLISFVLVFALRCYRVYKKEYMGLKIGKLLIDSLLIIALAFTYCFGGWLRMVLLGAEVLCLMICQKDIIIEIKQKLGKKINWHIRGK